MNRNLSVLTFGGASQDVFIGGKALLAKRDVRSHDYVEQFPLGAKVDLDMVSFETGGGATNAAVTFARQGFDVGYVGKIGRDPAGIEVMRNLQREKVATERVVYDARLSTQYSVIMLAPSGERTILVYRGAAHALEPSDVAILTL
jgi:ribokinase